MICNVTPGILLWDLNQRAKHDNGLGAGCLCTNAEICNWATLRLAWPQDCSSGHNTVCPVNYFFIIIHSIEINTPFISKKLPGTVIK